jgi:hypothetical protein
MANDFFFMKHVLCRKGKNIHNIEEPYVLRQIRADGSNLSTEWINLRNLKEILFARIGLLDKLALLNRLLLPGRLADYLVMGILRKNIVSRDDVKRLFSGETWLLRDP